MHPSTTAPSCEIHGIGPITPEGGMRPLESFDFPGLGALRVGEDGVTGIAETRDRKAVFLSRGGQTLAYLPSNVGIPSYYPLRPAPLPRRVRAVLMDLDGTSVRSEGFWVYIIERVTARLLGNDAFRFTEADLPYVSGFSVSEHLEYCLRAYCPGTGATLEQARRYYFELTEHEMAEILVGRGRRDAFTPAPGLREFLLELKAHGIKIGLVTSGLHQKAWPEIVSAFEVMGLGDPLRFYDAIVTAGASIKTGHAGTLGELQAKPHPWLYSEVLLPLGIPPEETIGIEDSSAGVVSIRLAGVAALGVEDGNIRTGGAAPLCAALKPGLAEIWHDILKTRCS
jgi:beta-phosphoglucomutase-like phosphatase (HAD superfamily)